MSCEWRNNLEAASTSAKECVAALEIVHVQAEIEFKETAGAWGEGDLR